MLQVLKRQKWLNDWIRVPRFAATQFIRMQTSEKTEKQFVSIKTIVGQETQKYGQYYKFNIDSSFAWNSFWIFVL